MAKSFKQFLTEATQSSLKATLVQVTREIIDEMDSFDGKGVNDAWTINGGYCDQWVELAIKKLHGGEEFWMDEEDEDGDTVFAHCMLRYNGRLYDSQHLDGIKSKDEYVPQSHEDWKKSNPINESHLMTEALHIENEFPCDIVPPHKPHDDEKIKSFTSHAMTGTSVSPIVLFGDTNIALTGSHRIHSFCAAHKKNRDIRIPIVRCPERYVTSALEKCGIPDINKIHDYEDFYMALSIELRDNGMAEL